MNKAWVFAIFLAGALLGGCAASNNPHAAQRNMPTTFDDAGPNYPDTGH
jgi:hypothetical protein